MFVLADWLIKFRGQKMRNTSSVVIHFLYPKKINNFYEARMRKCFIMTKYLEFQRKVKCSRLLFVKGIIVKVIIIIL
jgi:hypothetical protein